MIYNISIEELRKIELRVSLLNVYSLILMTVSKLKRLYFFEYSSKSNNLISNYNVVSNKQFK